MNITLTPDQRNVVDKFERFLQSDRRIFIIKGSAGTGKTTLLKYLIELTAKQKRATFLMAPTGRASQVITEKLNLPSNTIHKRIYNLEKDKVEFNDCVLFGVKENNDSEDAVYFVDEASMIADINMNDQHLKFGSGALLNDLIAYTDIRATQRKLVFIGDYAQLPPVGQSFSPAMSEVYLTTEYSILCETATLTAVVRQNIDSGIYKNADAIRHSIDTKSYNQFGISPSIDISAYTTEHFLERYMDMYECEGEDSLIVITASNSQALNYNTIIRKYLYGEDQIRVQVGDKLMITQNNYSGSRVLFNGSFVRVKSVEDSVEIHRPYVGKKQVAIHFRSIEIVADGVASRHFIIDDFLTAREGRLLQEIRDALWADFAQRMERRGIKRNTTEFRKCIETDPYYNALHCKYGYAITCHKSQGGEWNNVWVDMNVWMGKTNEIFFRWAYTALTRAKKHLFYTSSPEFSPISQFVVHPIVQCKAGGFLFDIPQGADYKTVLFDRICTRVENYDWRCSETRSVAWQHRISFQYNDSCCTLSLWENSKFYTGKIDCISTTSAEFAQQCKDIVKMSMYLEKVVFHPKFEFQNQMHSHIVDILNESDATLTNIEQTDWCDTYYIATEADTAYIKFFYNSKGFYTNAQPFSTLGNNDIKLRKIIDNL